MGNLTVNRGKAMNNPVEQINAIKNMDDFLNFVVALAMDAKENPSECNG